MKNHEKRRCFNQVCEILDLGLSYSRTESASMEIYNAGATYLKAHMLLAHMSFDAQSRLQGLEPLLWTIIPKMHTFHHQLIQMRETRMNCRHHHCFTDEDGMRYVKQLARKALPVNFEWSMLRASLLRLQLTGRRSLILNRVSAKRSAPP